MTDQFVIKIKFSIRHVIQHYDKHVDELLSNKSMITPIMLYNNFTLHHYEDKTMKKLINFLVEVYILLVKKLKGNFKCETLLGCNQNYYYDNCTLLSWF